MKSKQVLVILVVAFSIECNLSCDLNTSSEYDGCDFNSLFLVNPQTGFTVAQENCGVEVDKSTFQEQPYVFYPDANEDLKYTLIMVDDDDDPLSADEDGGKVFLQWMIVNIDGTAMKYGVGANYGETFAAYLPTNPSQETCIHYYTVYVFEQNFHPLEFPDLPSLRTDFNLNDFVENVIPRGTFCGPVASIEFQSRY